MATDQRVPEFEGWAVVELMGHRRLAGYVREASAFGTALLRLDVPGEDDGATYATQYYGGGSIYAVTPCTEEIARAIARRTRETPEAVAYALPAPKRCESSWRFPTPCSPDLLHDPDDPDTDKICGRHKLERDLSDAADEGEGPVAQLEEAPPF